MECSDALLRVPLSQAQMEMGIQGNPSLPVVDLCPFLADPSGSEVAQLCTTLAACLRESLALVVRDPRVGAAENEHFLGSMEEYFSQAQEAKLADARPEVAYQVGITPAGTETPRLLKDPAIQALVASLGSSDRPTPPTGADPKWRIYWRLGERPKSTRFPGLYPEQVVPAAFPEWQQIMEGWGGKALGTVEVVAQMAALGFGLEQDAFTSRMSHAPHLVAPNGTDLETHGHLGTAFAGFHYDLNFLTIHGRPRYPGLFIWLPYGRRVMVHVPEGCLLLQAGRQMEWLTGGTVKAGYHEVVCTKETLAAARRARQEGRPLWRVSSTVFTHIAPDVVLQPLGPFAAAGVAQAYPPTPAGSLIAEEASIIYQ